MIKNELMPQYQCHKKVRAMKIRNVMKHAHPDPKYDDAVFETSSEFQGAHLFFEDQNNKSKEFAPLAIDADWYRNHSPRPGGYYIVYEDGSTSFSLAEVFELDYTRI